jgi:CheY-like chemotaxis protein
MFPGENSQDSIDTTPLYKRAKTNLSSSGKKINVKLKVVDDNAVNRKVAEKRLKTSADDIEDLDLELSFAATGKQALEQFIEEPVDIVLLDYEMDGENGETTACKLREEEAQAKLKTLSPKPLRLFCFSTTATEYLDAKGEHLEDGSLPKPLTKDSAKELLKNVVKDKQGEYSPLCNTSPYLRRRRLKV